MCSKYTAVLLSFLVLILSGILVFFKDVNPQAKFSDYVKHFGRKTQNYFQKLQITRIQVTNKLPSSNQKRIKVIHLTDFHFDLSESYNLPPHFIEEVHQVIQKEKPDFLWLTGDYIHWDPHESAKQFSEQVLSRMSQVVNNEGAESRVIGVLGNHDLLVKYGVELVKKSLRKGGLQLLENEYRIVQDTMVLGFDDVMEGNFDPTRLLARMRKDKMLPIQSSSIVVALSHNPDTADCLLKHTQKPMNCSYMAELPIHLMLSGHTHGGQIMIPFVHKPLAPFLFEMLPASWTRWLLNLLHADNVVKNWSLHSGLFKVSGNEYEPVTSLPSTNNEHSYRIQIESNDSKFLYVNKGVGNYMGLRLNCHPELVVLEFA